MVFIESERLFVRQWVPDDWKRFRPLGTDQLRKILDIELEMVLSTWAAN